MVHFTKLLIQTFLLTIVSMSIFTSQKSLIMALFNPEAALTDVKFQLFDISKTWQLVGSKYADFSLSDTGFVSTAYYLFSGIELISAKLSPSELKNININDFSSSSEVNFDGGRVFEATLKFNYKYNYVKVYSDEGTGYISMYTNDFLFKKLYSPTGEITGSLQITLFTEDAKLESGKYKDDAKVRNFITFALTQNLSLNIQKDILSKLNQEVSNYYSKINKTLSLDVNTPMGSKIVEINIDNEKLPINHQDGIFYFLNGQTTSNLSVPNINNSLTLIPGDEIKPPGLNNGNNGLIQLNLDIDLFNNVFSSLTKDKEFIYTLENSNLPSPSTLDFELSIEFLGKIYPGNYLRVTI